MAGPSIVVRVLGDLSGLGKAFEGAGKTAESGLSKIHGAFGSMLGTLNASGVLGPFGTALAGANDALGAMVEHGKTLSGVMLGAGGALAGVGMGLQALGSHEQASHQQLQQAIQNTGKDYDDYASAIEGSIHRMEGFGFTAGKTQDALRILTQATHDPQKALDLLGTVADVAKGKHEDLNTAATQVGRVFNGNTKLLKEYGIIIDKTTGLTKDGKTATQALADVTRGQAAAATDTFAGRLDALKAKITDAVSQFGQKYGPAITAAGTAMAGLGAAMQVISALGPIMGAALDLALGPVGLIILAIAALAAAAYVIYRNWDTIWSGMKALVEPVWRIIQDVWHWIADNWPLLLAILLGPFALALYLIVSNWSTLIKFFSDLLATIGRLFTDAWNAIWAGAVWFANLVRGVWDAVIGFIAGMPGRIAVIAGDLWHWISDGANWIAGVVRGIWDGLVGWFSGLPGRIAAIAGGMWNWVGDAFKSAINVVIRAWNGLHFTTPHVSIFGVDTPSVTIGVPQIPYLQEGGIITRTGLVYAHAGEAITPAGRGPAVNIENVNLHDGADVDLLLQRLTFATTAGRL